MKAAVWTDYGKIEIKEVPMPVINENEVLLTKMSIAISMVLYIPNFGQVNITTFLPPKLQAVLTVIKYKLIAVF